MLKEIAFLVLFYFINFQSSKAQEIISPSSIRWYSLAKAFELSEKENKPVLLDIYANWNSWCEYMMTTTFADKKIADYINRHFIAAKLNAETIDTIVFKGKKYVNRKVGRRSVNDLVVKFLQGSLTYPSLVFFDQKGEKMIVQGYKEPKDIEPYLVYFAEGLNNLVSIEDFIIDFMYSFPKEFERDHSLFKIDPTLKPDTLGQIKWHSIKEIDALTRKKKKATLFYIYTDSCYSCKIMERVSLRDKKLSDRINLYYNPVKLHVANGMHSEFLNSKYGEVSSNYKDNQLTTYLFGDSTKLPAIVILDKNDNLVAKIHGFLLSEQLSPLTDYFHTKIYKKKAFQEYIKESLLYMNKQETNKVEN